jgi:hypothetical protein
MAIDILCTGLSLFSYDWNRVSFKWGLSQYREAYKGNINLYFAMHEGQAQGFDNEIGLESYPLKAIQEWSGSNYFTSSTAFIIAYAIYTGEKEINLYGIDMEDAIEYTSQRPCIAYWIGFGRAKGCTIKTATALSEPPFLYGYDTNRFIATLNALEAREKASREKANETTGDERNQWIGAMFAYQKMIEQIRS